MIQKIENTIEAPGTAEELWECVSTGAGLEAWMAPAQVRDGKVFFDMGTGEGMQEAGVITAFEPPHRFAYEERWPSGSLGSEFLVEPGRVRVVSTLDAAGRNWEAIMRGLGDGLEAFLAVLKLYRTHFPGQSTRTVHEPQRYKDFADLANALGLDDIEVGDPVTTTSGLSGLVEVRSDHHIILRLRAGVALIYAYEFNREMHTGVHLYLYELGSPS